MHFRFPSSCGCESRREIMFTRGELGVSEAVIVAGVLALLLVAWRVNQ